MISSKTSILILTACVMLLSTACTTTNPTQVPAASATNRPRTVPPAGGQTGAAPVGNASVIPAEPTPAGLGPFAVKQIESGAPEVFSGDVCNVGEAFNVNVKTSDVAYIFKFQPANATGGKWEYAYLIPAASERHNATGIYTLTVAASDGSFLMTMQGTDRATFKGADANRVVSYQFNLLPVQKSTCSKTR